MPAQEVSAIYKRVSSRQQSSDDCHSLPEQERMCRDASIARGYQLDEVCIYQDVIPGDLLERPALEQAIADARKGLFTRLIVASVDRFSRDSRYAAYLIVEFERAGVTVEFLDGDDSTEEGRMLLELRQMFARFEQKRLRWRTQTNRRARVKAGKIMVSSIPLFGYLWDNPEKGKRNAYIIDPETAPIVRRIFEAVAAGVPIAEVVRRLECEQVPTPAQVWVQRGMWPRKVPTKFGWRRNVIIKMLNTPAYWGEHVAFRFKHERVREIDKETGKLRYVEHQTERTVIPEEVAREWSAEKGHSAIPLPVTACPPIISKEIAMQVRTVLERNKKEAAKRPSGEYPALLRGGFAVCGYCNSPLYCSAHATRSYRYYCYRGKIRLEGELAGKPPCEGHVYSITAQTLDDAVWSYVISLFSDSSTEMEQFVQDWLTKHDFEQDSLKERIASIDESIKRAEKRRENIRASFEYIDEDSERAVQKARLDTVNVEIQKMQKDYQEFADILNGMEYRTEAVAKIKAMGKEAVHHLETASIYEKRAVLHYLGVRVFVYRQEVNPRYRITVGWEEILTQRTDSYAL